jgi:protein involved in polysaccharide export with SLBB domain
MTLLRAVTGAGGFPLGLRRPVAVVSSQISGRIERTEYDLTAIMKGDKPDPFLRPGDRIDVRESGD